MADPIEIAHEADKARLQQEIENYRLVNEKLSMELADLRAETRGAKLLKRYQPFLTALVGVIGFTFGVYQYLQAETKTRADRARAEVDAQAKRDEAEKARLIQQDAADRTFRLQLKRETTRPLWDRQLQLYLDAAEAAATIATSPDLEARKKAEARFFVLYYGPLAAVEDVGIASRDSVAIAQAMVDFKAGMGGPNRDQLPSLSLNLARAIRDAIKPSFDLEATPLAAAPAGGPGK